MKMEDKTRSQRFEGIKETRRVDPALQRDFVKMYKTYGSSRIADYEASFSGVLKGKSFKEFLEERPNPLIVIDLMSPTDVLASLFKEIPGKEKRGLAVGLSDLRQYSSIDRLQRDKELNISYISNQNDNGRLGDISINETWDAIDSWLDNQKADLIVERAEGGLISLPHTELFYKTMLQRIWDRLKDDGGMFVGQTFSDKVYKPLGINLAEWVDRARIQGVDINHYEGPTPWSAGMDTRLAGSLRIVKHLDSPEELPT